MLKLSTAVRVHSRDMNQYPIRMLLVAPLALGLVGCIHHHETVRKDLERLPVSFENDTAARMFYETLEKRRGRKSATETRTEVSIPVIFDHEVKTVEGPNTTFNEAVTHCDTNRDGRITEAEARIFADNAK
jgi:hypothetical protein